MVKFFSSDFITPVVASGLLFDFPGLLVPQLRLAPDRAVTLENAFERAWDRSVESKGSGGLDKSFYGRWSPKGNAPALFFNTTSSNYGVPVVISELFLAEPGQQRSARATAVMLALRHFDRTEDGPLMKLIGQVRRDCIRQSGKRSSRVNTRGPPTSTSWSTGRICRCASARRQP